MNTIAPHARVCPHCGAPAGESDYCCDCGFHLAVLRELPTRTEWEARGEVAPEPQHRLAASPSRPAVARPTSSVRPLLHPSERSRLAIAVGALALFGVIAFVAVVRASSAGLLTSLVGVVLVLTGLIWLTLQVARAYQLGRSVRVTSVTFPEIQTILDDVKDALAYNRRVEVYVASKEDAPITTVNYLGTRIMVLEGGLIGGLLAEGKEAQLTFLIGREIGALKARLTRLDIFVVLLNSLNALKVMAPFLMPYYRATTYSGDQIGAVCAGDLGAALEATRRLLVGEKLAASLGAGVVLPQAVLVRRRLLPRFAQLLVAEPHITNRYANLLCFGRYHDPQAWAVIAGSMSAEEAADFEYLWQLSPYSKREARMTDARSTTG